MVDINPINPQSVTVNVPSNGSLTVNNPGGSTAQVSTNADAQLAYSWACGVGLIQGIDYSAKYWAGKAKESELIAVNAIQGVEDAKDDAIAELESAKDTCLNDIELAGDDKVAEIEGLASDYESTLIALTYRAETAATNAETSETNAATSATSASTSATNASNSATSAATNANLALGYKNDAYASADFAGQYKTAAEQAKTDAQYYRTQASGYAAQASNAATGANQSATSAAQAKTAAENARDAAGGYAQQAETAKEDIEAELDNYVPNTRKVNNKPLSTDITLTSSDIGALANTTKYGYSVALSLDTTNYKLTLTLKDQDGTALSTKTVDFPIESVVVNGSYDSTNQKIVLTLQSGSTIDIPVGDLISGLQSEITSTNMLDSDLVDDTNSTHKFATVAQLNQIATNTNSISNLAAVATSGSYNDLSDKPTIPDAQVQADWDVTDTTSKAYIKNKPYIPSGVVIDQTFDGTSANAQSGVAIQDELSTNYQSKLVSGTNIKTINNTSLLGSGNIDVLQNTATGSNSITILGTATSSTEATNIGYGSEASSSSTALGCSAGSFSWASTAIGYKSSASNTTSTAIGAFAYASADYAIQLGRGTNSTAKSLQIGFGTNYNYTLLDGTTGLIPDARISTNIARTSAIPTIDQTFDGTSTNGQSGMSIIDLLDTLYPVGSIYIGTMATCPLETLGVGTWTLKSSGQVLQGSDANNTAGSSVSASLPQLTTDSQGNHLHNRGTMDIKGGFYARHARNNTSGDGISTVSAGTNAFSTSPYSTPSAVGSSLSYNSTNSKSDVVTFTASNGWSGSTNTTGAHTHTVEWTGNVGTTVQPPAYIVNIWERTA